MQNRTCAVPGCERTWSCRDWCTYHYNRWRRHGTATPAEKVCGVIGCDKPHSSKGYCSGHYQRFKKTGDPGPAEMKVMRSGHPCAVDGCERPQTTRGWCTTHYDRWMRNGDPGNAEIKPIVNMRGTACKVEGCARTHYAVGYCQPHWKRWKKHGDPGSVEITSHAGGQCSFVGCARSLSAKGLCNSHYAQHRRGDALTPLVERMDARIRDAEGRKRCPSCKRWLALTSYYIVESNTDGFSSSCNDCSRDRVILGRYGITGAQYAELLASQGGVCAICKGVNESGRAMAVDHDHGCCSGDKSCGKCVRGLLCSSCNMGIGLLKEDVARLEAAINYLKRTQGVSVGG